MRLFLIIHISADVLQSQGRPGDYAVSGPVLHVGIRVHYDPRGEADCKRSAWPAL
ncbi:hypothetical protein D3C75_1040340 [compost metagenome]